MKSVVVTGSTRGIGFGMADEFLRRGHRVTVCGRSPEGVGRAVEALEGKHGSGRVFGRVCDVASHEEVRGLCEASVGRFGGVDVWINNAGLGNPARDFWELPVETVEEVVRVNVIGAMHGSRVRDAGDARTGTRTNLQYRRSRRRGHGSFRSGALRRDEVGSDVLHEGTRQRSCKHSGAGMLFEPRHSGDGFDLT